MTMLVFALPKSCFSNLCSVQFSVVYHNLSLSTRACVREGWSLLSDSLLSASSCRPIPIPAESSCEAMGWHSLFQGRRWGGSNVFQARNKVKHVLFWGLVIQEADDTKFHKDVNVIICYSYELLPHPFLSHIDSVHCYARSWSARHQRSKNQTDFAIVQCMMSLLRGGTS